MRALATTRMSSKGQIVIPEEIRKSLGLNEGNQFIVLGEKDKIYWFVGVTDPKVQVTDYSKDGVRKVLTQKNEQIKNMVVLIKASDKSKYENMVDILDEMSISNIARYALVEMTPEDEEIIKRSNL